jgi:hypothetical protein
MPPPLVLQPPLPHTVPPPPSTSHDVAAPSSSHGAAAPYSTHGADTPYSSSHGTAAPTPPPWRRPLLLLPWRCTLLLPWHRRPLFPSPTTWDLLAVIAQDRAGSGRSRSGRRRLKIRPTASFFSRRQRGLPCSRSGVGNVGSRCGRRRRLKMRPADSFSRVRPPPPPWRGGHLPQALWHPARMPGGGCR